LRPEFHRRDRRGTRRGDDRERIGLPSPEPCRPAHRALSPSLRSLRSPRRNSGRSPSIACSGFSTRWVAMPRSSSGLRVGPR